MKKFIVLYHAPKSLMANMPELNQEQKKKTMDSWMEWEKRCGSGLIDMGAPLGNAHSMSQQQHGPSESDVVGYSILQAESWDEVKKMMDAHPHVSWNSACQIEIHEVMPMPSM